MEFPRVLEQKTVQWATLIPDRSPEFKVHSSKGLANSALAMRFPQYECARYTVVDGKWVLDWEYHLAENCSRCGNKFPKYNHGRNLSEEVDTITINKAVICDDCWAAERRTKRVAAEEARERKLLADLQAKYKN